MASLLKPFQNSKHNNNNSFKYKLDCQTLIDKHKATDKSPDTKDWLHLVKQIEHDSADYILYNALLEKHKQIVVKIDPDKLQNEYEIGKLLDTLKLPTFLGYICMFSCLDDFYTFKGKTKEEKDFLNSKRTSLCKKDGEKINILVMPYINSGTIDKYKWTKLNFDILKNVIKHIVITILYSAITIGFIHTDAHLGNIMIQKTKRQIIKYGDFYEIEIIGGIMPIIMDYDKAIIQGDSFDLSLVYNDINKLFNLLNAELKIKFNISRILDLIRTLTIKKILITKEVCDKLLYEIDSLIIYLDLNDIPPMPSFLQPVSSRKM
jgi:hypothetical protein